MATVVREDFSAGSFGLWLGATRRSNKTGGYRRLRFTTGRTGGEMTRLYHCAQRSRSTATRPDM